MLAPRCHELAVGIPHLLVLAITKGAKSSNVNASVATVFMARLLYTLCSGFSRGSVTWLASTHRRPFFAIASPRTPRTNLSSPQSAVWRGSNLRFFVISLYAMIRKSNEYRAVIIITS